MDEVDDRLAAFGADVLSDQELLALVLRDGVDDERPFRVAQDLLDRFGSLKSLSTARAEELGGHLEISAERAAALVAAFQLSRRSAANEPKQLRCPADIVAAALPLLDGARQERLLVLVCDAGNRLRQTVKLVEGAVDRAGIPVREILNVVLRHDGRAFALAHNHPSGVVESSEADRRATEAVRAAATIVGLRLLGHVILTDDGWAAVA